MKKFTATLAIVGTVIIQRAEASARLGSHNLPESQQLRTDSSVLFDHNVRSDEAIGLFQDQQPILRQNQVPIILGEELPEDTQHRDNCDGLDSFHRFDQHQEHRVNDCDCAIDDWGCDSHSTHRPGQRHIVENRQSVVATVVPVQTVVTNTTQDITGDACHASFGKRQRDDVRQFQVEGNFKHSSYDVQQQCDTQGECFNETGAQRDRYWDVDYDHDVDCECHGISGKDFLGFEEGGCDCRVGHEVENPDEDIERRVTKEVEKTISELLSDIVSRCISESIENCIQWH
eukprot:403336259